MKIHLPTYYLRNLTHKSLQNIAIDEVETTLQAAQSSEEKFNKETIFKEKDARNFTEQIKFPNAPITPFSTHFKKPEMTNLYRFQETPKTKDFSNFKFKKPLEVPATPNVTLINLSFSQPSTPKNLFPVLPACATPGLFRDRNTSYGNNSNVPFTPLLNEAMRLLDETNHVKSSGDCPDILQMIDDDSKPVDFVDKQIHFHTDVNLCDNTVVDYLLDLSNDYKEQKKPRTVLKVQTLQPYDETLDKKRKCRRAKPISFEESLVFHEQKKQRERDRRQKRKERFKQKYSQGTRKSTRRKTRISYS